MITCDLQILITTYYINCNSPIYIHTYLFKDSILTALLYSKGGFRQAKELAGNMLWDILLVQL